MLLYSFVSACSQCLCLHVVDGPSAMSAGYLQTGGGVIDCHLDKGVLLTGLLDVCLVIWYSMERRRNSQANTVYLCESRTPLIIIMDFTLPCQVVLRWTWLGWLHSFIGGLFASGNSLHTRI